MPTSGLSRTAGLHSSQIRRRHRVVPAASRRLSMRRIGWRAALLAALVGGSAARAEKPAPAFAEQDGWGSHCFCLSPDGKRVAMNSWAVWDIPGRKRLLKKVSPLDRKFDGIRDAKTMSFSPDGKLLAVAGSFSEFRVYDSRTGKVYWACRAAP